MANPASAEEIQRAITAAETNPKNLTPRQKDILASVSAHESGSRGNKVRSLFKD